MTCLLHGFFQYLAQPFFESDVIESLNEDDFMEHHVDDFVYSIGNNTVLIKWNTTIIPPVIEEMFPNPYTVDISLHSLDPETETHSYMGDIGRNVPNTGSFEVNLPNITDPSMVVAVGISVSETSVSEVVIMIDDDNDGNDNNDGNDDNDDNDDNDANDDNDSNDGDQDDFTPKDIIDGIKEAFKAVMRRSKKFIKNPLAMVKTIRDVGIDAARRLGCEAFGVFLEPENIGDDINNRLPPCPPTSSRARRDRQFVKENPFLEYFTVGTIEQCYRQNVFTR